MRRRPNPWVVVPVMAGAAVGGALGWTITDIGCRPEGCLALTLSIAFLAALVTGIGVGVIVVLALRSMEEFHDASARGEDPPGPGCEVPDRDE